MTEDCPGYDRDSRVCLIHPGECPFLPADGEASMSFEMPEALVPDTTAGTVPKPL